ncbi:MAG: glycosyltransferase family 4 protein [Candidatus Micrarchaeia archaeon]
MARVLIFDTSSRLGAVGGAQRVAANLFYELRKRGISTFYLGYMTDYFKADKNAMFLKESKQKALKQAGERHKLLQRMIENRLVRAAYYISYSLRGIKTSEIEDFVSKINPEIVLANSILDYIILKRVKSKMPTAKIIYIDHANASGEYRSAFDYNIMQLTFGTGRPLGLEKARKRLFGFFDGVIALNMDQYEVVKRYNSNVTIIHSSSLLESNKRPKNLESFKKKLNLNGKKIVLYLGRLAEAQKNVSTLIKAFMGMDDKELRMLIVGDGKSRLLYEQMSAGDERISIVGRVREEILPYYYSIADLYVLPSIWESFNSTFIEAATFGTPLLLSENAINRDIKIRFGKRLFLFNPTNIEELREKMRIAIYNNAERKKLILLSRDLAREYSKKAQMDAYFYAIKCILTSGKLTSKICVKNNEEYKV